MCAPALGDFVGSEVSELGPAKCCTMVGLCRTIIVRNNRREESRMIRRERNSWRTDEGNQLTKCPTCFVRRLCFLLL